MTTSPGFAGEPYYDPETVRARDRTETGVLLVAIGLALGWIPYIGIVGGLLSLIGIILLFLGREGFGDRHRNAVVVGGFLLVLSVIAAFVLGLLIAGMIVSIAQVQGVTLKDVTDTVIPSLESAAGGAIVIAAIGGLGQILLVFQLADRTTRWLLVIGLIAAIVVGAALYLIEVPQIEAAFRAATISGTLDRGPIVQLQNQMQLEGLLRGVPALISAYAFLRVRNRLRVDPPAASVPTVF